MFINRDVCNLIFYDLQGIYPVVILRKFRWYHYVDIYKHAWRSIPIHLSSGLFLQCLRKFLRNIYPDSMAYTYCFVLCILPVNVVFTIMLHNIGLDILYFKMTYTLHKKLTRVQGMKRLWKICHISVWHITK